MDRGKVYAGGTVLVLVVVAIGAFQTARLWARDEIHRIERQADSLRSQRDSIVAVTAVRDSMKQVLDRTLDSLGVEASTLRTRVASLEERRAAAQLGVWRLRTNDATEQMFRTAFPEFAGAMRATDLAPNDGDPPLRYLMVPTNFARSFIVYRNNSESFEAQRDSLLLLDSINLEMHGLEDSVRLLGELNERVLRIGYDSAYAKYDQLRNDYVKVLGQPRFTFNVPTVATVGGALALGIVAGLAVR